MVELHEKQRTRKLFALDVGRHGLFLATDDPPHERHLVQLTVHLPEGPIKAAASVMRTIKHDNVIDGVGVQFFALSGDAKQRWDDFIFHLQRTTPPQGIPRPTLPPGSPGSSSSMSSPPTTDPDAPRTLSNSQPPMMPSSAPPQASITAPSHPPTTATSAPPAPFERDNNLGATFLVKLKTVDRLRDFGQTHLAAGGTVLFTPVLRKEGEVLTLIVVHPKTDEEFRLPGFVHKAHTDRPKRLDIHFHGITPAIVASFANFVETGMPPAMQLEAPRALIDVDMEDDLDLDVDVFDEPTIDGDDRLWRQPGEITGPSPRAPAAAPRAPATTPAVDPGLKPTTFLLRCDHEGQGCSAEPYAVDLGPCRGVLGLVADHTAFLSNKTGRVVTAPRFVSPEEREARAKAFQEKGGKLDAQVELATLLAIATLAEPVKDPDTGTPLKHTRAVERLEHAALRLEDGAPAAKTKVACSSCKEGHLTVEKVSV